MKSTRIGYAIILFIIALWVYLSFAPLAFISLCVIVAMPLISLIFAIIARCRIRIVQNLTPESLAKGNDAKLQIKIKNPDIFTYPYIALLLPPNHAVKEIKNRKLKYAFCSVRFLSTCDITFTIPCKYRGLYYIGISEIYVYDFFGLFRFKKKLEFDECVTVYPKYTRLDELDLTPNTGQVDATKKAMTGGDPTEVLFVDEYQPSDSMRQVHWKLSSKLNELMVKRYADEAEKGILLVADLGQKSYETEINYMIDDCIIENTLSVLDFCVKNNITVELNYFAQYSVLKKCEGAEDFQNILSNLTVVECDGNVPVESLIDNVSSHYVTDTSFIVVTDRLDDAIVNSLTHKSAVKHTILFYVYAESLLNEEKQDNNNKIISSLTEIGVTCYHVNAEIM